LGTQIHLQRGHGGVLRIGSRRGAGLLERARSVLEAVQEPHLKERHVPLLGAQLAFHLGVERGQEVGVQQDARVALQDRHGVESHLSGGAGRGAFRGCSHLDQS
jgi:hypothetical protein